MSQQETLLRILELARWAPSGDNTQPWRFEICGDLRVAVHGLDTSDWCVYDFRGHPSHMAHGALLETMRIAASDEGLKMRWCLRQGQAQNAPIYDVEFERDGNVTSDPLVSCIRRRVVQRRPMRTTPLTLSQREALANAAGDDYEVDFLERLPQRWAVARVLWGSAYLRLICREAYEVHRRIIEWGVQHSEDRIPEAAVGVDAATAKLMRWVMGDWKRVSFFNRYLMGTVAPRIQLDLIPALACAAHIVIKPRSGLDTAADFVALGCAMQRVWLTAAHMGLHMQPEMTPVIFRWYARTGDPISRQAEVESGVRDVARAFETLLGISESDPVGFFCRVGRSPDPVSRSVRQPLARLMLPASALNEGSMAAKRP